MTKQEVRAAALAKLAVMLPTLCGMWAQAPAV